MTTAPLPPLENLCRFPLQVQDAQRDAPEPAFDAAMRQWYPTEREMEAILARKLARRSRPVPPAVTLDDMTRWLQAFLQSRLDGAFEIADQRWFAGGASKIQMGFTLEARMDGDAAPVRRRMVVRMEPAESLNSTSRAREFQLLRACESHLPVPHAHWVDDRADHFPEPALIYDFADGVTKPSRTASGALSGIGTQFDAGLRAQLGPQFVRYLAKLHTIPVDGPGFEAFDIPEVGTTQSAAWQLNRARRVWDEDRRGDLALVEAAADWLEERLPVLDRVSIVHGDYRSGNFLFDEASARITSLLDWERGYLGDRHRDLAWATNRVFGCLAEDGRTFLASGLVPLEPFLADYQRASGLSVDPDRLRWYTLFNAYQVAVAAIGSSHRVVKLGKSHQDILLVSTEAVGYGALEILRRELEALA
jgi:aminoglycoside phosphotransferase (APT) family kinase protein